MVEQKQQRSHPDRVAWKTRRSASPPISTNGSAAPNMQIRQLSETNYADLCGYCSLLGRVWTGRRHTCTPLSLRGPPGEPAPSTRELTHREMFILAAEKTPGARRTGSRTARRRRRRRMATAVPGGDGDRMECDVLPFPIPSTNCSCFCSWMPLGRSPQPIWTKSRLMTTQSSSID